MSVRLITRNPVTGAAVAVVLLLCAAFLLIRTLAPAAQSSQAGHVWYFDLNEQKLFAGKRQLAPIDAPSGALPDGTPAGVLAHVYSCGECESDQQFIGYLEKQSADSREMTEKEAGSTAARRDPRDTLYAGQYVRLPEGPQWVPARSKEGRTIINTARGRCPEGRLHACVPTE